MKVKSLQKIVSLFVLFLYILSGVYGGESKDCSRVSCSSSEFEKYINQDSEADLNIADIGKSRENPNYNKGVASVLNRGKEDFLSNKDEVISNLNDKQRVEILNSKSNGLYNSALEYTIKNPSTFSKLDFEVQERIINEVKKVQEEVKTKAQKRYDTAKNEEAKKVALTDLNKAQNLVTNTEINFCKQMSRMNCLQYARDDKNLMKSLIEAGTIDEDLLLKCVALEVNGCNAKDLNDYNNGVCDKNSWFCELMNDIDIEKEFRNSLDTALENSDFNIRNTSASKSFKIGDEDIDCSSYANAGECFDANKGSVCPEKNDKEDISCLNNLKNLIKENSKTANAKILNQERTKAALENLCSGTYVAKNNEFCNNFPEVCTSEKEYNSKECKTELDKVCKNPSDTDKSFCGRLDNVLTELDQSEYYQVGEVGEWVLALLQPDQQAIQASKLFGFEADYSKVPTWLQTDTASQICLSKIDGYLDAEIKDTENGAGISGGTTKYNCGQDLYLPGSDANGNQIRNPNYPCVNVVGDIRGQKLALQPNGQVQIDYSYYIQGHATENVTYTVMIMYEYQEEQYVEFVFEDDFKQLGPGEEDSDARTIQLPLQKSDLEFFEVEPTNWYIALAAQFQDSTEEYLYIDAKMGDVEPDNYVDILGQNPSSSSQSSQNNGPTEDQRRAAFLGAIGG